MEIVILPDSAGIGRLAADVIETLLARKPHAVLGLATGSSPLPIYQDRTRRHRAGRLSFADAEAFTLDEYVGLPDNHPELYREVIRREFTQHVDFPGAKVHSPDGSGVDVLEACNAYENAIRARTARQGHRTARRPVRGGWFPRHSLGDRMHPRRRRPPPSSRPRLDVWGTS